MGKKVMIVDDAAAIRQTVGFTLQEEGYEVVEAADGKEALGKLQQSEVDLIICDVNMPEMDGISLIKTLKGDDAYEAHKFTPLIMLTTETGEDRKEEGKKAGAKVWMVKPFKPEQLIETVKKLIK